MYQITDARMQELRNQFSYHAPTTNQIERYELIRYNAKNFAITLENLVPPGRQRSLAITALEEVVMRANAGIAQGEI